MDAGVQVLLICLMFAATIAAGFLPVAIIKSPRLTSRKFGHAQKTLRAFTSFAAGVFLGTSMLELVPNTTKQFARAFSGLIQSIWTAYPIAEFVIILGFLMVLILEQTMNFLAERKHSKDNYDVWDSTEMLQTTDEDFQLSEERHESVDRVETVDDERVVNVRRDNNVGNILLLVVLSLHSVFEGLALGFQREIASLWTIFAALVFHKAIIAFSLSTKMLRSRLSTCRVVLTVLFFSVMSPVGISIATLSSVHTQSLTSTVVECIMLGLSTGTFLYVTFVEILPKELEVSQDRLIKVASLCLGYVLIAAVRVAPTYSNIADVESRNDTTVNIL